MKRASETAEIIAGKLGLSVEPDPLWMERNFGEVEGLTADEVRERYPERSTTPFKPIIADQGEGNWELYLRAGRALQNLLQREPGRYLVVSHGGLLNQLLHTVVGVTPKAETGGIRFHHGNTGFTRLVYDPGSNYWHIRVFNDSAHLNGKAK